MPFTSFALKSRGREISRERENEFMGSNEINDVAQ